jgi:hypothetical protein
LDVPTLKHLKEMCVEDPFTQKFALLIETSYADEKLVNKQPSANLVL